MKKFLSYLLAVSVLLSVFVFPIYGDDVLPPEEFQTDLTFETVVTTEEQPILNAKSAILIEASTGRVLYEKNAEDRCAMASTTKIMTALVVIETGNLQDVVTISKHAASTTGSTIHLQIGEQITVNDLLYGLLLSSGNDAAVALAEHIAGSEEAFLECMNQKAVSLGLTNTHFATVHGLDHKDHYSTAYDMATLASVCMKNETFRRIVSTTEIHISQRTLRNTNDLLFTYAGATGLKTGYTDGAGRCLIASAKRDGMELIAVVLGCESKTTRFSDSRKLLDYGFENFSMTTVLEEGAVIMEMQLIKGKKEKVSLLCSDKVTLPMADWEKSHYEVHMVAQEIQEAPCLRGTEVGTLYISHQGEPIASCQLLVGESVERKGFWDFWQEVTKAFWAVF